MGNEEPGLKPEFPADNFFDRRGELAPGRKGRRAARTAPYATGNGEMNLAATKAKARRYTEKAAGLRGLRPALQGIHEERI
jgi:hypothetical protein